MAGEERTEPGPVWAAKRSGISLGWEGGSLGQWALWARIPWNRDTAFWVLSPAVPSAVWPAGDSLMLQSRPRSPVPPGEPQQCLSLLCDLVNLYSGPQLLPCLSLA